MNPFKQIVLLVLDGFGVASPSEGNAVSSANPRNLNYLINHFPVTTLQASGPSVGLPWGERGNSEVGHQNLGAGRIVSQDISRINTDIAAGNFFKNEAFLKAAEYVKKNQSKLHLIGLVSPGGVHSSEEHLHALVALAAQQELKDVFVHMITDGRDTGPKAAEASLDKFGREFLQFGIGKIATIGGRFYAMDRGGHWEVIKRAYDAIVKGRGETAKDARGAILQNYAKQITDETIPPTVIMHDDKPVATVEKNDAVIFFNFRPDRMTQLAEAFTKPKFDKFGEDHADLEGVLFVTMTAYENDLPVAVAYPPIEHKNVLAEVLSASRLSQFHIAESEKYAHVTSFFNGGREKPWPLEEREIVTSPAAYEKRYENVPEMSADKVAETVIAKLQGGTSFILANFANPDMVGHTGNKAAGIAAVNAVDKNIGLIFEAAVSLNACVLITADHGNIEQMVDPRSGLIDKEHSSNPVPLIVASKNLNLKTPRTKGYLELPARVPEGVLSDVSPTILELMNIPKPAEMDALSLLPLLLKQIE